MTTDIRITTDRGEFAGLDFGGSGQDLLLVHELGGNAEVWRRTAEQLTDVCHPVAVDARGHGQTLESITGIGELRHDIAAVVAALGLERPVVLGEGSGGWTAVAAQALGLIDAAGVGMIDSVMFIGSREKTHKTLSAVTDPDLLDLIADRFSVGWTGDDVARRALLATAARLCAEDWVLAEADPGDWPRVMERALVRSGDLWRLQPSKHGWLTLTDVDSHPHPFPSSEPFADFEIPVLFIDAAETVRAQDEADLAELVEGGPFRRSVLVPSPGRALYTATAHVVRAVRSFLADVARARAGHTAAHV